LLQGCYSQGDTIDEALDNIKEAILLFLKDLESIGAIVPDPSKLLIDIVLVTKYI